MKDFQGMLNMIRNLQPGEMTTYMAENVPMKVCVSFMVELDEDGKVSYFNPHLNFYPVDTEAEVGPDIFAQLEDLNVHKTKQDVVEFIEQFAAQIELDQKAQVWYLDEDAG